MDDFIAQAEPYVKGPEAPWPKDSFDPIVFASMAPLVQERVKVLSEIPGYVDFLFVADDDLVFDAPSWEKVMVKGRDKAEVMLDGMIDAFESCEWDVATLDTTLFVKNGPCMASLGLGGEGYLSFSIATPTGEGVTTPLTFTRERRCSLIEDLWILGKPKS